VNERKPYPSDLSDERWALIEPVITAWKAAHQGSKNSVVAYGATVGIDVEIVERNPAGQGFVRQPPGVPEGLAQLDLEYAFLGRQRAWQVSSESRGRSFLGFITAALLASCVAGSASRGYRGPGHLADWISGASCGRRVAEHCDRGENNEKYSRKPEHAGGRAEVSGGDSQAKRGDDEPEVGNDIEPGERLAFGIGVCHSRCGAYSVLEQHSSAGYGESTAAEKAGEVRVLQGQGQDDEASGLGGDTGVQAPARRGPRGYGLSRGGCGEHEEDDGTGQHPRRMVQRARYEARREGNQKPENGARGNAGRRRQRRRRPGCPGRD
jgi:hypothetical protein